MGLPLLHALNAMAISPMAMRASLEPPRRYSDGGLVGPTTTSSAPRSSSAAPGTVNVTIQSDPRDVYSRENVERYLIPVLSDKLRRSGVKL